MLQVVFPEKRFIKEFQKQHWLKGREEGRIRQREESSYAFLSEDLAAPVGVLRWDDSTNLFFS